MIRKTRLLQTYLVVPAGQVSFLWKFIKMDKTSFHRVRTLVCLKDAHYMAGDAVLKEKRAGNWGTHVFFSILRSPPSVFLSTL